MAVIRSKPKSRWHCRRYVARGGIQTNVIRLAERTRAAIAPRLCRPCLPGKRRHWVVFLRWCPPRRTMRSRRCIPATGSQPEPKPVPIFGNIILRHQPAVNGTKKSFWESSSTLSFSVSRCPEKHFRHFQSLAKRPQVSETGLLTNLKYTRARQRPIGPIRPFSSPYYRS